MIISSGQSIAGTSLSSTVMSKEHISFGGQLLLAVMVTVVTPALNIEPLPFPFPLPVVAPEKEYVSDGVGVPVTVVLYVATASQLPSSVLSVISAGQTVNAGASLTVMVTVPDTGVEQLGVV